MHGDRVAIRLKRGDRGRISGEIMQVVKRVHPSVVGEFRVRRRGNYVVPHEDRIRQWIEIPEGMEFPKKASADRVGARAVDVKTVEELEGMIVNVEILDFGDGDRPIGRITEVLGKPDDFGVDVEILIRSHHIPHEFPDDVLDQARSISHTIPEAEFAKRRDFRSLDIVTIDGETARDFDDAVWVEKLANGNFALQVHIADVSYYVKPGSAIDREALLRGTSVYFPDRAVPMLPIELSTDQCSLRPHEDRLVLSALLEIDKRGDVVAQDFTQGVIRSAERMTYTAVHGVLEGDAELKARYRPLVARFELMQELALILNKKRVRRGSIDFDMPEPLLEFDEFGTMIGIKRAARNDAHRLIEEFMLAANETVAHHLESHRIASLYRIHEKPDAKRVYEFETIAATFGYSLGVGALPIKRVQMKADRRAAYSTGKRVRELEIPQDVHITPRMYQKLTEKIAGKPEERILSYLMLRSLKQARYSEENQGNFALAATTYTHFTSPIRRYPDLIVHRILKEVLRSESQGSADETRNEDFPDARRLTPDASPSPWSKRRDHKSHHDDHAPLAGPIPPEELHSIAEESSQSERRADDAERELMEWKKAKFMQDRLGEIFDGLITSVTKFGFFVELTELFVEGLVPLNTLTDDYYTYHENTREIIGQRTRKIYHIGDRVKVIVDRIDPVEKKINFAVLEEEPAPSPKRRKRK
jgi:ribonuclease R